jgi:chemotaxis protein MotA
MLVILGFILVIAAIVGGYLLEHGQLLVLFQPAELLIIGGAAAGTILIAHPMPTVVRLLKGIMAALGGSGLTKEFYLENLKMLNDLFQYARKNGLPKLEADVDEPAKSVVFSKYPKFLKNHHALHFVCDTLRMFISGGVDPFELDQMMELDMEVHHHEVQEPVTALSSTADALPGLGIVAAVLGVVITMGALGGPPEEIGHKVAAALVGTFLGILLCYGFLGPLAARMSRGNEAEARYYQVIRVGILAFVKGSAPVMSVEFARRAIPYSVRPTFQETEKICRGKAASPAAPAAA